MRRPGQPRFPIAIVFILMTTVQIAAQEAPATPVSPFAGPAATPVGDFGANVWEEVDVLPEGSKGQNLGWDLVEGWGCYPEEQTTCDAVGVPPVAEYQHGEDGCAVMAIGVVRGTGAPSLKGLSFNSDFCTGKVWGLAREEGGSWQYQELLDTTLQATGGGEDEAGALYPTSCQCSYDRDVDPFASPGGTLWRIVAAGQVPAGASVAPREPTIGPAANPSSDRRLSAV